MVGESQGRNPEAETGAEIMKERCLLATPNDLVSYIFHIIQDHLPRNGTAHVGLGSPVSINN